MKHPLAIIGMGNPLMTDEGIGVRVVGRLQAMDLPGGVEALDLGTSGMAVLHEIAGRRKVVFVDCAAMGERPGTLRRFTPDQVASRKVQTRLSLHEGDLLQTIALARRLGSCPDDIVIFGIEPAAIEPGDSLSPDLAARLSEYVATVRAEVDRSAPRRRWTSRRPPPPPGADRRTSAGGPPSRRPDPE